jgi:mannitol-1-phosphate/altronate dehydrogenase
MKYIPLTCDKMAMVDDDDFEWLIRNSWYYNAGGYACRERSVDVMLYMHIAIVERHHLFISDRIDHIDQNGINNQKQNLRPATRSQNAANRGLQTNNTSGYKGVVYYKRDAKWVAQIKYQGSYVYLGRYSSKEAAAKMYDIKAKQLFGEYAVLNFPLAK